MARGATLCDSARHRLVYPALSQGLQRHFVASRAWAAACHDRIGDRWPGAVLPGSTRCTRLDRFSTVFRAENGYGLWGPGAYVEQLVWYDEAMRQDSYGRRLHLCDGSQRWLGNYGYHWPSCGCLAAVFGRTCAGRLKNKGPTSCHYRLSTIVSVTAAGSSSSWVFGRLCSVFARAAGQWLVWRGNDRRRADCRASTDLRAPYFFMGLGWC